jgi:hypothetical protein
MLRSQSPAPLLAERLCRPQRIGVFGHRGVGKTTLLTMLYREAVNGRWPAFRLAAADSRTAEYLTDKIVQLEAGQRLPATLSETDLRWHLYHRGGRIELLVKDYQGEHVELGRDEPIRAFLRDCDAIWLCLDAATLADPPSRLRRQQEVEQLLEDYLATEPAQAIHRPTALVLTKADLLPDAFAEGAAWQESFAMTRHAMQSHCPTSSLLAVSSLGPQFGPSACQPINLDAPLAWLVTALQTQDEARLERLWSEASGQSALLQRCLSCFARRYPQAPITAQLLDRLRSQQRRQRRRRILAGVGVVASVVAGLWTYDTVGYRQAQHFASEHSGEPALVLQNWQDYHAWHPTRNLLRPGAEEKENQRLADLRDQVRQTERDERLSQWRRHAADPDADPEVVWQEFRAFREAFPETDLSADLQQLRDAVEKRRAEQTTQRAERAYYDLQTEEARTPDPKARLALTERYLHDYPQGARTNEVRRQHDALLARLEDRDLEVARAYSRGHPLNFQTRREHYLNCLNTHPEGALRREAEEALLTIESDWDKHDCRAIRDQFLAHPGDLDPLRGLCLTYLTVHPHGRYKDAAGELLRWSERVRAPGEYKVKAVQADFDHKVAFWLSRGPDLSVELEVAGIRYGPSPVIANRYDPDWDYEFPRRIRWKFGDPVVIRVHDHDYWKRLVLEITSDPSDPLAPFHLLNGETASGNHWVRFQSDFVLPTLPPVD